MLEQLERYTLPMSERYVAPQEKWADAILEAPIKKSQILEMITRIETSRKAVGVGI